MNIRTWSLTAGTLVLAALITANVSAQSEEPPPDPTPEGVEVQARGPVHEAFAEPTDARPQPSIVVAKKPPDPIDEIPPDEKPAGDNVVWIPGYWAWDKDTNGYLWVSGFWRVPPPRREWVPGSWQEVEGGWQWAPGFWAAAGTEQLEYLPAPPPSLDSGPSTEPADDDSIYVPGCWVYRERRYFWRPGFWVEYRPDWVWIPAHYVWTPGGYVFVEGYWDRPLERRGLLFAPVRIDVRVLADRFRYTPYYVVRPDFLLSALFVRPSYSHYYFGDYFEDRYRERGFVTWIDHRPTRGSYDPNFAYYRHRFGDGSWERNLRELYVARERGDVPRPPRTLVQQDIVVKKITVNKTENVAVSKNLHFTNLQNVSALAPVTRLHDTKVTGLASLSTAKTAPETESHVIKVERLPQEQRAAVRQSVTEYRAAAQQRRQAEAKIVADGGVPVKPTDAPKAVKVQVPKPPRPPDQPKVPVKEASKPPVLPKHEERPAPPHEPPSPPAPPKHAAPPPKKEPTPPVPPPPKKESPPPPSKEAPKPPALPKEPPKSPPPASKEPPPAPKPPAPPPPKEAPKPPPPPAPKGPPKEAPPAPKPPPKSPPPKEAIKAPPPPAPKAPPPPPPAPQKAAKPPSPPAPPKEAAKPPVPKAPPPPPPRQAAKPPEPPPAPKPTRPPPSKEARQPAPDKAKDKHPKH